MWEHIGTIAAVILPLWNVPLMLRIVKRRSAGDISLWWLFGVWVCVLLMAPSGFQSADRVWRVFNMVNLVMFTAVVGVVMCYRRPAAAVPGLETP